MIDNRDGRIYLDAVLEKIRQRILSIDESLLEGQKEIDEMDEEDRNRLVLWGGSARNGAYCGLASAGSNHDWSYSAASIGSRLAVKSSEIAIYFGEQFKELWKDFLIGKK